MLGGINPRDLRFRSRFDGVVEISKEFSSGDGSLSSPGAAGPRHWPKGQLSPRADCMSANKSAITRGGVDFYTVQGGVDPMDLHFQSQIVRVVQILKEF